MNSAVERARSSIVHDHPGSPDGNFTTHGRFTSRIDACPKARAPPTLSLMSRRNELLDNTIRVLAQHPGAEPVATLREVASSLGCSPGAPDALHADAMRAEALHLSADELTLALAERALEALDVALGEIASGEIEDVFRELVAAIVPVADRFRFLTSAVDLEVNAELDATFQGIFEEICEVLEAARTAGLIDEALPAEWPVYALEAQLWAAWLAVENGSLESAEAAALAHRTLLRGLGSV